MHSIAQIHEKNMYNILSILFMKIVPNSLDYPG